MESRYVELLMLACSLIQLTLAQSDGYCFTWYRRDKMATWRVKNTSVLCNVNYSKERTTIEAVNQTLRIKTPSESSFPYTVEEYFLSSNINPDQGFGIYIINYHTPETFDFTFTDQTELIGTVVRASNQDIITLFTQNKYYIQRGDIITDSTSRPIIQNVFLTLVGVATMILGIKDRTHIHTAIRGLVASVLILSYLEYTFKITSLPLLLLFLLLSVVPSFAASYFLWKWTKDRLAISLWTSIFFYTFFIIYIIVSWIITETLFIWAGVVFLFITGIVMVYKAKDRLQSSQRAALLVHLCCLNYFFPGAINGWIVSSGDVFVSGQIWYIIGTEGYSFLIRNSINISISIFLCIYMVSFEKICKLYGSKEKDQEDTLKEGMI